MFTDHDGKDALLHLTCVLGAKDNHLHALEVDLDGGRRGHALGKAVGGELAGVVDDKVWLAKVGELCLGRSNQHVVLGSTGAPSIGVSCRNRSRGSP